MKARTLLASLVLLSALNIPTLAGEMDCPVIPPPPPPQTVSTVDNVTGVVDPLLEITLRLLQDMLSLF